MSRMETLKKRIDALTAEQSSLQQEVADTFAMRIAKSRDAEFLFDMDKRQLTKFAGYVCRMLPVLKENFDDDEEAKKKAKGLVDKAKKPVSAPKAEWNPGYEKVRQPEAHSQQPVQRPVTSNGVNPTSTPVYQRVQKPAENPAPKPAEKHYAGNKYDQMLGFSMSEEEIERKAEEAMRNSSVSQQ